MIPTIPQPRLLRVAYGSYVALFFMFLALPLTVVAVFAFNDSQFPSLPWEGFTWGWFFGDARPMIGVFHERPIIRAVGTSAFVALFVSLLSVAVGTSNAPGTSTSSHVAPQASISALAPATRSSAISR